MIGCDSDEERQLALGRPSITNHVSRCRQVHKSDIEPCPYTSSPIYRVSYDVLHSIFELYCQVEVPATFPLQFRPSQVIASQVCSAWRQIMLGNPIFWNRIRFVLFRADSDARFDPRQLVEVPRVWLSRTKDLPCFINFIDCDFKSYFGLAHRHPILQLDFNQNIVRDLIAPHKCKSLGVIFADHHLHDLLQLSNEKLSYIEVLHLDYVHDESNDASRETVSPLDFHRLTNLTSFSLRIFILHHSSSISSMEHQYFQIFSGILWHQLRHIHLDVELLALRGLDILEMSSPVLETCSLVVCEDPSFASSSPSQIKSVHCQQLREFKVFIRPDYIQLDPGNSFFYFLRLPKLKSLIIQYPNWGLEEWIDIQTLFRISAMHLEKLIISGAVCHVQVDVGAILAGMPSLRCLEPPEMSIFTLDTSRELGAGSIGPFLEELTINNPKITDKIGELIQMVKMRCSSEKDKPTPFKSVFLNCEDHDGSLRQEYDAIISEINQFGVKLTVNFLDEEDDETATFPYQIL